MMHEAAHVCEYLVGYAASSLADLTDEHLALEPASGAKTAGWILGHLCITGDYIRRKSERPSLTPNAWGPAFAPGSQPSHDRASYPPMAELRAAFENVYRDLAAAAPTWSPELLASVNPRQFARGRFPTFGEFATYIMTGHLGYHLGQLVGWRAAAGLALRPGAKSPI
jgi:hypothetical protein